jgi:hypothetical protein
MESKALFGRMKPETRMSRLRADVAAGLGNIGRREAAPAVLRREPEANFNEATGSSRCRIGNRLDDVVGERQPP